MKCVILCGGYATRLHPISLNKAKSLLEIKGKPILDYIMDNVSQVSEVDEVFIVTNEKFHRDFDSWLDSRNFSKKVIVLNDKTTSNEDRLGGIGDLWFAIEQGNISEDLLLILGDNYFDFDLNDIVSFFKKNNNRVFGLVGVDSLEEAKRFGVMEIDSENSGKILSFEEKPEKPKSTHISAGVYIFGKDDLRIIGEYMKTELPKDGPGYLVRYFLEKSGGLGFPLKGFWYDIGNLEVYKKVNE